MLTLPLAILLSALFMAGTAIMIALVFRTRQTLSLEGPFIDRVSALLGELELHLGKRIDGLEARLDAMEKKMDRDSNNLHKRLEHLDERDRMRK
jgi:hypothetical protein